MASKEATVYVVDLGATTADCHSGRVESDLDYGMRYVWEKIAQALSANRASLFVGVVAFRTDKTKHQLDHEEYENICVLKPCEAIKMGHLRELQRNIKPNHTQSGDAISAIVVAIDLIHKATLLKDGKTLAKFKRKIVVLTDGQGHMDSVGLDDIASQIKELQIDLAVIGIDFDDNEYGFKEEDKSKLKKNNEKILQDLVEKCDGVFGTAAEAIDDLAIPEIKPVRPYSTYNGKLSLGDWQKYEDSALYIDVKRYSKVTQKKPVSASNFVSRPANGTASGQSSHTLAGDIDITDAPSLKDELAPVKNARSYIVKADREPGGRLDVERDELAKGYEYGRTAVPISESEENVTKLETFAEFTIIGFIPSDKYEKYLNMGESRITVAESMNDKARMALSSLIHALHELDSYAVARIVLKDGKDPSIILLAPLIDPDIEALIDVPLPFAEDVRTYRFPPLDRVITTSGATVKTHRNLPSDELVDAMSDYVDSMDLSTFGKDEDGDPTEYMQIEDTSSPLVYRINQGIRRRATHPDEPIAPAAGVLLKYSSPPPELVSKTTSELNALMEAASVMKVPPKVKGKRTREVIKPLSGLNIDEILGPARPAKISKDNAIPEFKQRMASTADNTSVWIDAIKQMGDIIRQLIRDSTGQANYGKVLETFKALRYEALECELPDPYNKFIQDLKRDLLNGNLGPSRKDLWFSIKHAKLGLIHEEEAPLSEVSVRQAIEFSNSMQMDLPMRTSNEK